MAQIQMYQRELEPEEELETSCMCSMHVHKATKLLMWFKIICGLLYCTGLTVIVLKGEVTRESSLGPVATPHYYDQPPLETKDSALYEFTKLLIGRKEPNRNYFKFTMKEYWVMLFWYVNSRIVFAMVLWGLWNKRPSLYKPYLVWVIIETVFLAIKLLVIPFFAIGIRTGYIDRRADRWLREQIGESFLVAEIGYIFALVVHFYLNYIIVRRSYKLLKDEVEHPVPPCYHHSVKNKVYQPVPQAYNSNVSAEMQQSVPQAYNPNVKAIAFDEAPPPYRSYV